jgi:hypothetical protein
MAFVIYHERFNGRICEVIPAERAEKLQKIRSDPDKFRLSRYFRKYIENIRVLAMAKPESTPAPAEPQLPTSEVYDKRYP